MSIALDKNNKFVSISSGQGAIVLCQQRNLYFFLIIPLIKPSCKTLILSNQFFTLFLKFVCVFHNFHPVLFHP